ncbi:integrase core domain-containing protein [Sagittula marina]|uniref:integrase core domain-containing protein n=1 Tax=Sagittula marina TaxID=943940 RepID=UPI003CCDA131
MTQNAYVERCNRVVRHECLELDIFETIDAVQQIATRMALVYNNERPDRGNNAMTPAQKLRTAAQNLRPSPRKMRALPAAG